MDPLQFQKADFAGSSQPCSLCKRAIDKTYYHLNGVVICPACAAQTEAAQQRPGHTWVMQVPSRLSPVFVHFQVSVSSGCFWQVCIDLLSGLQRVLAGVHSRHSPWVQTAAPEQVTVRRPLPSSRHTETWVDVEPPSEAGMQDVEPG